MIEKTVDNFTQSLLTYDLKSAMPLMTKDSKDWLKFMASNLSQTDISKINSLVQEVSYDITDIDIVAEDSATAVVEVHNALLPQGIGEDMQQIPSLRMTLTILKEEKIWRVDMRDIPRMEVLQQSETQSHAQD